MKETYLYQGKEPAKVYEILGEDFRTATMIVRPDESNGWFHFAHTSLQEYFLASHLMRSLLNGTVEDVFSEVVISALEDD